MEFSPSVYEHAAKVIGRSPWDVSRDAGLLSEGNIEAFRLYGHRPVVVGIDIYNLEAEAYGATVQKPSGNGIPAISRHPFAGVKELLNLEPLNPQTDGRIPMVIEAARRAADACTGADVRLPLAGPFSIAANLVGFENLLCDIQTNPDLVIAALHHLVAGQVRFCEEVVRHGLDIAFFESAAAPPLLSPANFRDIELGPLQETINGTAAVVGHAVPCIIGGDTLPILDYLLQTGTKYVCCPAETNQQMFMEKMQSRPDVMVRINMDPRGITAKKRSDVQKEVDRVLALTHNRPNVCIGTGCLPFEADPEVVLYAKECILSRSIAQDV